MKTFSTALLAHQGGWDEILLVAGPIAIILVLLMVVKKRIDRAMASRQRQVDPLDQGTESH